MRKLSDDELRELTPPAEQRRRVAARLRLAHGLLHVARDVRERGEVRVEDLARLIGRDVETLTEPVGLHAVREPVVHDLREAALERVDLGFVDVEDARRGGRVDVGAAFERLDQAGIVGEVREHAQLDLRVVGGQQRVALVGDERAAQLPTAGRCGPGCSGGSVTRSRCGPWSSRAG